MEVSQSAGTTVSRQLSRYRPKMLSFAEFMFALLGLCFLSTDLVESVCVPGSPVVAGTIRLPRNQEILPLSVFDNQIVGNIFHALISGFHPSVADQALRQTEILFTRPSPDIVRIDLKALVNGECVYEDVFRNTDFDTFFKGNRAEFKVNGTGTYVAVFSANPASYAWVLVCLDYEDNMRRCPDDRLILNLYTRENPPNNINLEQMGRDLRMRTCLNMELVPEQFTFAFTQGTNTCVDDGV